MYPFTPRPISRTITPNTKYKNNLEVDGYFEPSISKFRGDFDASSGGFPKINYGSGVDGKILAGDFWRISVGGTLGALVVTVGDLLFAKIDHANEDIEYFIAKYPYQSAGDILTPDEVGGIQSSASPSALNPFLTTSEVFGVESVSRTIYVATTGNDVTGDGTVGLPYLTISKALSTVLKNINSGVTVTISIGAGTFSMTAEDVSVVNTFYGLGVLIFTGQITLIESGFTMGAADANDPFTYAVSGGNTATWTLNQWKYYFLKSGTSYYPITHNALMPSLSIAGEATGTEIYQLQTILNIVSVFEFQSSMCEIQFQFVEVDVLSAEQGEFAGPITSCYFKGAGSNARIKSNGTKSFVVRRCAFNSCKLSTLKGNAAPVNNCYLYATANTFALSIDGGSFSDNVIESTSASSSAAGIYLNSSAQNMVTLSTSKMKFVNCVYAYRIYTKAFLNLYLENLILVNTTYLVSKSTGLGDYAPNVFLIKGITKGAPLTRWFYESMYEFVNIINLRSFQIAGILYPEAEMNLSATLTNNATTNVIVGNKLQNKSVTIEYTITRGTGRRVGRFDLINDGTNLIMGSDKFTDNGIAEVSEANIVLSANFNTNEIRIAALLSNSGNNATFQYEVKRKMIIPLTI